MNWLFGITLSADEQRIYGIPQSNQSWDSNLYVYDIATGTVALASGLEPAIYTGSHMRDSRGNIYFAKFGDGQQWEGQGKLLIVQDRNAKGERKAEAPE